MATLLSVKGIDEIYVYCSSPDIKPYLPDGVNFLQRPEFLDSNITKSNEILRCFTDNIKADIYILTHVTSPFLSKEAIERGIEAVKTGKYDSAFTAKKLQTFLWQDGLPLNYKLDDIPRTQDLPAILEETSGFYIFRHNIITELNRRIGNNPFIVEVGEIESIDIDEPEDFTMADAVFNYMRLRKNGGGGYR